MIKVKTLTENGITGFSIVILYILSLNFSYSTHKGEHMHLALGLFCFETSLGLSIWRKIFP